MARNVIICLGLVTATVIAFAPTTGNQFVRFDDDTYIVNNPHVRQGLTWSGIRWSLTTQRTGYWHPVTWWSLMLDCQVFGVDPAGHHGSSLAYHLVNALLLLGLLRSMTGAVWRSALVAALFALHPLQVEPVAWAAQRKDLLSTMFWLGAAWAYVGYTRRMSWGRYLSVLTLFALGLMAKPMVVTLPVTLLLLDVWPLGRLRWRNRATWRRPMLEKLPMFAMSAACTAWTIAGQQSAQAMVSLDRLSIPARLANTAVSYVTYLAKAAWPVNLAVLYPHPTATSANAVAAWQVVAAAGLLGLITAAALVHARRGYPLVGWLWFLVVLAPVSGLLQVGYQAMADRYAYVSMVGIYIVLAWGCAQWAQGRAWRRRLVCAAAIVMLGAAGWRTYLQTHVWRNGVTLFEHSLVVCGPTTLAHYNLATILRDSGQPHRALHHFRQALALKPYHVDSLRSMALLHRDQGRADLAVRLLQRALQLAPDLPQLHNDLGTAYAALGRLDLAAAAFRQTLTLDPQHQRAAINLDRALRQMKSTEDTDGSGR